MTWGTCSPRLWRVPDLADVSIKAKQVITIAVGIIVAIGMLLLGLWQMSSFQRSMVDVAAERASQESVALADSVQDDGMIDDIYGRLVTFSGSYLPQYEVMVGTEWPMRVVTLFQLDDGRHISIVLGTADHAGTVYSLPTTPIGLEGVFTSGDGTLPDPVPTDAPPGSMATLRLQSLVQDWPQPLISGYVTLDPSVSADLGLGPAEAVLPEGEGTAMHQGYAMQWWVFAAASIAFSIVVARGFKDDKKTAASTSAA